MSVPEAFLPDAVDLISDLSPWFVVRDIRWVKLKKTTWRDPDGKEVCCVAAVPPDCLTASRMTLEALGVCDTANAGIRRCRR